MFGLIRIEGRVKGENYTEENRKWNMCDRYNDGDRGCNPRGKKMKREASITRVCIINNDEFLQHRPRGGLLTIYIKGNKENCSVNLFYSYFFYECR